MNAIPLFFAAAILAQEGTMPEFPPANALKQLTNLPTDWSEGPVWIEQGQYLLFGAADTKRNDDESIRTTLYRFSPSEGLSLFAPEGAFRSNGLAVDALGNVYGAMHDKREVARLRGDRLSGRSTVVCGFAGRPFNSPNDLAIRGDGTVYLTDPTYEQADRPGQEAARVYRIGPDGVVHVVDERDQPNGIALSPQEDALYVGGRDQEIRRYAVAADGSTGEGEVFARTESNVDGMTVDDAGNVYASLYDAEAIAIYSPAGDLLHRIETPGHVTNLAFGDRDRKTLYVTCGGQLYSIAMPVAGRPY